MSGKDKSQKTEKATPKKVKDARKEGQVAKSQEVASWSTTLVMTLVLPWTFDRGAQLLERIMDRVRQLVEEPEPGPALALWGDAMQGAVSVVGPMAMVLMLVGVAANLAQVGFTPSPKALKPKLNRLNPLPGLKRLVGAKTMWNACKEVLKLVILGGFAWSAVDGFLPVMVTAGGASFLEAFAAAAEAAMAFLRNAALLGLVLAAADYAMQRKQMATELKMTKQEVKDEFKQADGDPQMKGLIRERQMRISRNRMMADVARADVVMVNPTHVAVALVYDPTGGAPRVVAKGSGAVAARIRERAQENRVPMVRDIPLARALHKSCEIGDEIPAELYAAVARVLAFLFSLKARGAAAGTHVVPGRALAA